MLRRFRDAASRLFAAAGDAAKHVAEEDACGAPYAGRNQHAVRHATPFIMESPNKHSHYFRPCPYDSVDVYRVLAMFDVSDPCIQHSVKKLLVAGGRGAGKSIDRDIQEAIDALERWKAMRKEELAEQSVAAGQEFYDAELGRHVLVRADGSVTFSDMTLEQWEERSK